MEREKISKKEKKKKESNPSARHADANTTGEARKNDHYPIGRFAYISYTTNQINFE